MVEYRGSRPWLSIVVIERGYKPWLINTLDQSWLLQAHSSINLRYHPKFQALTRSLPKKEQYVN